MLDLALILFILAVLALGIRRPFIWVLAYLYIDILAPQKIGWSITAAIPVSLIAFCAAFAGYLAADSKKGSRFTLRQGILVVLLCYCAWTTSRAEFAEEALVKWDWVWKALVFAIFLPLTLRTKLRIEAALLIMVLTAATIITNAGIKTVFGGGGYGTLHIYVNDNSGMYESSTLATVAIAIIPLIVWLVKFGTIFPDDWRVRLYSAALIFSCPLIPIGTEARTGLVCIAVLAILLLRDVKRRLTFIVAGAALGVMALPFLPQSYYERMSTISGHKSDESASTRVAVWMWTLDYASRNPMGGGFEIYRGNKFEFEMPVAVQDGNTTAIEYQEVVDQGRAFHSAIFEMLGEQGWPGLFLWLWLHAAGLWQMERLRHRFGRREGGPHWQGQLASALQNAQIIYLVGSLFQGIAYQPFVLMLIGLQCALWSYCKRLDLPVGKRRITAPPSASASPARDAVATPGNALR